MSLVRIPAGERVPDLLHVVVETPMRSRGRFEYDPRIEAFRLVTSLGDGVAYPADYGFIPSTMSEDGYPLDVFLLGAEPTFPGCVVECRPVAVIHLSDGTRPDHKILAVPARDPAYEAILDLPDVPREILDRIAGFLRQSPMLSGTREDVLGWENADAARKVIFMAWEGFL
jgi:inorganic pyrophosphatase